MIVFSSWRDYCIGLWRQTKSGMCSYNLAMALVVVWLHQARQTGLLVIAIHTRPCCRGQVDGWFGGTPPGRSDLSSLRKTLHLLRNTRPDFSAWVPFDSHLVNHRMEAGLLVYFVGICAIKLGWVAVSGRVRAWGWGEFVVILACFSSLGFERRAQSLFIRSGAQLYVL